jgi:hypothetical protein
MTLRYHLPTTITLTDDVPAAQRERLSAALLDAVGRAVRSAAPAHGTFVEDSDRPAAREEFARHRLAGDGRGYSVPSYDDDGRPVRVPLRPWFPFRVRLDRRLEPDELLLEFVRQYRHVAGTAEADRVLGREHWHWTGTPPEVTDADLERRYKVLRVTDHSLRVTDAAQQASDEKALALFAGEQLDELNAEVDRRFRAATGRRGKLGNTTQEDMELAAYWLAIRNELVRQRQEIDALPPGIRDFLFTADAQRHVKPADYATVLRLARKLAGLTEAELAGYRAITTGETFNWDKFEASVESYLAEVHRFEDAGAAVDSARSDLAGLERLYALYKQWKISRLMPGAFPAARDKSGHRPTQWQPPGMARSQIDVDFRAALADNGIASVAAFEKLIADFLDAFEKKSVLIGLDLLARYDHLLYSEQRRLQAPGAAEGLIAALLGTKAKTLYTEAAAQAAASDEVTPDFLDRSRQALRDRLAAEAAETKEAADRLVIATANSPLVSEEGFDREALARVTTRAGLLHVLTTYVDEHRKGIVATRGNFSDQSFIYDLQPLLQASMRLQDIEPNTIFHQIITDKVASRGATKIATAIMLAVVTIAITIATAGTGTVALLGAITVFELGAWQAMEAYQEYARGHAAHLVGLLDKDPWFGWVVVAALGAGLDLTGVAAAIKPAEEALITFKATGDVARLANDLKAVKIADRLTEHIVAEAAGTRGWAAVVRDAIPAGRVGASLFGADALAYLVRLTYFATRKGVRSLDRFILELRASKLLAEGELSAQELSKLRAAFNKATKAEGRLRRIGDDLGLTTEQVDAVVETWSANPSWTLEQVEEQMRNLAAGATTLARPLQSGFLKYRFKATPTTWRAFDNMPEGWTVYLVHDAGGQVIYVGVSSRQGWVRWSEHLRVKGGEWLGQASHFEFTAVGLDTERLALALEDDLMRQFRPRFNKQWTFLEKFGHPPLGVDIPRTNTSIVLSLIHE